MVKVITTDEQFSQWLLQFLPQLLDPEFDLQPGEVGRRASRPPISLSSKTKTMQVVDRTDGKLVHLDGINFSRAWCLYNIANRLVAIDAPAAGRLLKIGDNHVRSGSRQIVSSQDISWHDNGIQDIY